MKAETVYTFDQKHFQRFEGLKVNPPLSPPISPKQPLLGQVPHPERATVFSLQPALPSYEGPLPTSGFLTFNRRKPGATF